jgi:hypothetical protein
MFKESGVWLVREADKHTVISKPIIYIMWDPQYLKMLQTSTACYGDKFTLLYADDVGTSQETSLSTACYGDSFSLVWVDDVSTSQGARTTAGRYGESFTLLYADGVRTSQETYLSKACYGDSFTFLCR